MKKLLMMIGTAAVAVWANAERDAAVEKLRQSVRKMKDKGFSAADIADLTGLTADEINAL